VVIVEKQTSGVLVVEEGFIGAYLRFASVSYELNFTAAPSDVTVGKPNSGVLVVEEGPELHGSFL
jgi:hypothetical protein